MIRILLWCLLGMSGGGWVVQDSVGEEGWDTLARVPFHSKFFKEHNEYFLVPTFDAAIRSREGKEIILKGHYMPFDLPEKSVILSKYPYAACFFCGGAGPESVAEVVFLNKPPRFRADQIITVKGKLKLNDKDVSHLNFILMDAELIK
jgi:hypothetical protein